MAKKSNLGVFEKYRVRGKFRLAAIDPEATPFARGDEGALKAHLDALAGELDKLQDRLHANGTKKLLLVLQGMDTSGKDGTIRWVFSKTSPLGVRVTAFKAPTEEERARDFLWRCHAVVPRAGEIMIWNRSHYEDVLVPLVNGWIDEAELERRYQHIVNFERLLVSTGTTLLKCMLHISRGEQRKRLQARLDDPEKHWKFNLGDLEVRKRWKHYMRAYERALSATSTSLAPWYVIPANDKLHRNVMVAELLVSTLEAMRLPKPKANPAFSGIVVE
ncbi:MAG: polyphosphate kinase 2 family protein [Burkholderiales bacterium]|nr:polyphosphate kinase 2 family protein [Burkholderiales bacterium]